MPVEFNEITYDHSSLKNTGETSFIFTLIIKVSGGLIKNSRQAKNFALILTLIMFILSFYITVKTVTPNKVQEVEGSLIGNVS